MPRDAAEAREAQKVSGDKTPAIDYVESGEGPNVLFVPGSYSTPAAWRPIQKRLPPRYRMAGTSLCGYGGTEDTRTPTDCRIVHEVRVVDEAVRRLGGPVHLVGHSFGATVALAAALSGRVAIAGMALFEANPLELLRHSGNETLYEQTFAMSRAFEAAVVAGEPDAAARIIDFWGGEGVFAGMPQAVRDYCNLTAPANVFDWHTAFAMRDYECAHLTMPVLLVRGSSANPAMVAITDALGHLLPDVQAEIVPGAGHFLISSHPDECAALLGAFLARTVTEAPA